MKVPEIRLIPKMRGWLITIDGENERFFYDYDRAWRHQQMLVNFHSNLQREF